MSASVAAPMGDRLRRLVEHYLPWWDVAAEDRRELDSGKEMRRSRAVRARATAVIRRRGTLRVAYRAYGERM